MSTNLQKVSVPTGTAERAPAGTAVKIAKDTTKNSGSGPNKIKKHAGTTQENAKGKGKQSGSATSGIKKPAKATTKSPGSSPNKVKKPTAATKKKGKGNDPTPGKGSNAVERTTSAVGEKAKQSGKKTSKTTDSMAKPIARVKKTAKAVESGIAKTTTGADLPIDPVGTKVKQARKKAGKVADGLKIPTARMKQAAKAKATKAGKGKNKVQKPTQPAKKIRKKYVRKTVKAEAESKLPIDPTMSGAIEHGQPAVTLHPKDHACNSAGLSGSDVPSMRDAEGRFYEIESRRWKASELAENETGSATSKTALPEVPGFSSNPIHVDHSQPFFQATPESLHTLPLPSLPSQISHVPQATTLDHHISSGCSKEAFAHQVNIIDLMNKLDESYRRSFGTVPPKHSVRDVSNDWAETNSDVTEPQEHTATAKPILPAKDKQNMAPAVSSSNYEPPLIAGVGLTAFDMILQARAATLKRKFDAAGSQDVVHSKKPVSKWLRLDEVEMGNYLRIEATPSTAGSFERTETSPYFLNRSSAIFPPNRSPGVIPSTTSTTPTLPGFSPISSIPTLPALFPTSSDLTLLHTLSPTSSTSTLPGHCVTPPIPTRSGSSLTQIERTIARCVKAFKVFSQAVQALPLNGAQLLGAEIFSGQWEAEKMEKWAGLIERECGLALKGQKAAKELKSVHKEVNEVRKARKGLDDGE